MDASASRWSVVDTITANRETWLATMMDEELICSRCKRARFSESRS
jgi:hypothetical protein